MGYRNQPVIKDLYGIEALAKSSSQLSQTIVQSAQMYAGVVKQKRLKKEKEEETYTRIVNEVTLRGQNAINANATKMVEKGVSLEMVDAYRDKARKVFNGNGTWEEGGEITETSIEGIGAITAQSMILGSRFSTPKERDLLQSVVDQGPSRLDFTLKTAGNYGAEILQIKEWIKNGMNRKIYSPIGFDFGDNFTSTMTVLAMADEELEGVESSMILNDKDEQVWTHYIDKNNKVLNGQDITASRMIGVTVSEDGDKYKMVQTFASDFDGDILTKIREKTDWKARGKNEVTTENGNLIADYTIDLGDNVKKILSDKGQSTNQIVVVGNKYLSSYAISEKMESELNGEAVSVATGMKNQAAYSYVLNSYGVDLREAHPTYFTTMLPSEKQSIIKKLAKDQMLTVYGQGSTTNNGFKETKLSKNQIDKILQLKEDGAVTLQNIPSKFIMDAKNQPVENPEFAKWRDGKHYMQTSVSSPRGDGKSTTTLPRLIQNWRNTSLKNFQNPKYGSDATENTWYIPKDEINKTPPQNEATANRISGSPDVEGSAVEIIQIGANLWQPRQLFQNSMGSRWNPIGKASTKDSFNGWLGIKK